MDTFEGTFQKITNGAALVNEISVEDQKRSQRERKQGQAEWERRLQGEWEGDIRSFSALRPSQWEGSERTLDKQYPNDTFAKGNTSGGCREDRRKDEGRQGRCGRGSRRNNERACQGVDEWGIANGTSASLSQIHLEGTTRNDPFRHQSSEEAQNSDCQRQSKGRKPRWQMDELPKDLSTELGSPKGNLLDKSRGGNDQCQEEPGASGYPSERACAEGECRGTGGFGQHDGRGGDQGEHGDPTLGYRNPRTRRHGTRREHRGSGQEFKSLATLWETTQEGKDQREEGRCLSSGGGTNSCFGGSYSTEDGKAQCHFEENCLDIVEYVNQACVDEMVNFTFEIAEIAEKCDYQHGYNIKKYVYSNVYDLMAEEHEVNNFHGNYHIGKFVGLTKINTNELGKVNGNMTAQGERPDLAPVLSRPHWDPCLTQKTYPESTFGDFNNTRSLNITGFCFEEDLYNTLRHHGEFERTLTAAVVIGIFLAGIPFALTWMLVSRFCLAATIVGVEGFEHHERDTYHTDLHNNILLVLFLGYLLFVRVHSETEAYLMAMTIVSNFCLDFATWCTNNICPLLVIGILTATLVLAGCQIGRCFDRRDTCVHRCVLICGERKTTRRRLRCRRMGSLKPIVWHLLVWNQVGVLAGNVLLNCDDTCQRGHPKGDDLTEKSYGNNFGAHGEQEGWTDDLAIFQTQVSAGSLPQRTREQSQELHQRMQYTQQQERMQWDHEREMVNRDTRITGQIEIQDEFDALDDHGTGRVPVFLFGLQRQQIGLETIYLAREDMEDFLDLIVHVRRAWSRRLQITLFDIAYINPQAPPIALGGEDGLSLIVDFMPTMPGTPIAILSSTTFPGDETTYDISVHRASDVMNKEAILRMTGFTMLCANGANCACTYVGRVIEEIPIRVHSGMRIDITIVFHQGWCQDNTINRGINSLSEEGDANSLMTRMPTRATVRRFFVYLQGAEEPFGMQHFDELDLPGNNMEERVAFQYVNAEGQTRPGTFRAYCVNPQPVDLAPFFAQGYVMVEENRRPILHKLVLADISIQSRSGNRRSEDGWRIAEYVPENPTKEQVLNAFEVLQLCRTTRENCRILRADRQWSEGQVLEDGAYIQIKVLANSEELPTTRCDNHGEGADYGNVEEERNLNDPPNDQMETTSQTTSSLNSSSYENGDEADESVSFLQQHVRKVTRIRLSFAMVALGRLPPPGNGPLGLEKTSCLRKRNIATVKDIDEKQKKVRFNDNISCLDTRGNTYSEKDRLITDDYILRTWSEMHNHGGNAYIHEFVKGLRFGRDDQQTMTYLQMDKLPEEEAAIDTPETCHDYVDSALSHLPIQEEAVSGTRTKFEEVVHLDSDETAGIYKLLGWLHEVKVMPYYDPYLVHWKAASKPWTSLGTWILQEADEMCYYVDGAKKGQELAAGVVMFVRVADAWFLGGFIGERLDNTDGKAGIYEAELLAQTMAYKWIMDEVGLQVFNFGKVPLLKIVYDSQSAGQAASGGFGGDLNNVYYVASRSMAQLVNQGCGWEVVEEHQKSHTGHPGNEAADDVAKWALQRKDRINIWRVFKDPTQKRNLQWLWWVERVKNKGHPTEKILDAFTWEKPVAKYDERIVAEMKEKTIPVEKSKHTHMEVKVVSYNINTFNDQKKSDRNGKRFSPGKFEAFTRMCREKNTHLFMLQETRIKRKIPDTKDYYIYQGLATNKGKGGVMIGISKRTGIFNKLPIREENVKVMMANEETLVLRVSDPSLRAILVSGHAPHSGLPEGIIRKWWQELTILLREKAHNWPIIFGIDSNGRLGSMTSKCIGNHQQAKENFCGGQLHAFCIATDTILPSTFASWQWGEGDTWQHPSGQLARLDYIGVPRTWSTCAMTAFVDQEMAMGTSLYDHRPCRLTMRGMVEARMIERVNDKTNRRRNLRLDYRDENTKRELAEHLKNSNDIPWTKDVHSHLHDFYEDVRNVIGEISKKRSTTTKRKNYISEETWQLVQAKKTHRAHIFSCREERRLAQMGKFFALWRRKPEDAEQCEQIKMSSLAGEIYHHYMFQTVGKQVTKALRCEDENFFGEFAENLTKFDKPQCQRQLWREIRRYLPRARERKRTTPVEQMDGVETIWANYLCLLEAGERKTFQQIYTQCIEDHNKSGTPRPRIQDIPTLLETEVLMRTTKMDKAMGMDQLNGDLLHQLPVHMAQHIWPIACKMALHATEPIQWKGGRMKWLHKKGSWDKAENFRGILLASTAGKRMQAYYRRPLMEELEAVKDVGQLGGFQRMETTYGSHYIRSFMRLGHAAGLASVVIFVDLSAAFHSLVRELLHGIDAHLNGETHQESIIQKVLDNVVQRGGRIDILEDEIRKPGFLQEIAAPEHLVQMMREMGKNNWAFTGRDFVTTHKGTRPGSPMADAMFHGIMAKINSTLTLAVANAPENATLCEREGIISRPILWADDVAFALLGSSNEALIKTAENVMEKVDALFTDQGMEVNYKKQKTEALFSFRGKQAGHQRAQWLSGDADMCYVQNKTKGEIELNKTAQYKHLGVYHASGGTMDAELHHRVGQTWATWRELRLSLFGPHRLTKNTKVKLAHSLMFTKLLHGAEAWPVLSRRQVSKVKNCYMGILRATTQEKYRKEKHADFLHDQAFLCKYGIPSLEVAIAKKRLLYAARMTRHGETLLRDILEAEERVRQDSWIRALKGDLDWLNQINGPEWGDDLEKLKLAWKTRAGWKAFVHKAIKRHIMQESVACQIMQAGAERGVPKVDLTGEHECHCGRAFSTKAQLGAHKHTVHGEHSETFWIAQGTTCYVCLRQFWKHSRLMQHLNYAPRNQKPNRCRSFCRLFPDDAMVDLENNDTTPPVAGLGRNEAIRLQGPLMLGAQEMDDHWAWTRRNACEKSMAEVWSLHEPDVLRDSELQSRFELIYSQCKGSDLGLLVEFLSGCDVDSSVIAVNLLFWGWKKTWKNLEEKQSWTELIQCCPEGPACIEWFEACLDTARCDAISSMAPHKGPNKNPANQAERLVRDTKLSRSIVDCLSVCTFPVFVGNRFWNKRQLEFLGHHKCPTGQYKELL